MPKNYKKIHYKVIDKTLAEPNKLKMKLETALDYTLKTCVIGSNNKIKNIKKTNGWCNFFRLRYNNPGQYINRREEKFSDKEDGLANASYDLSTNTYRYQANKNSWYYHPNNSASETANLNLYCIDPQRSPMYSANKEYKTLFAHSMIARISRQGNCGEMSRLLSDYLWRKPEGINRVLTLGGTLG